MSEREGNIRKETLEGFIDKLRGFHSQQSDEEKRILEWILDNAEAFATPRPAVRSSWDTDAAWTNLSDALTAQGRERLVPYIEEG
jgi:hypothetical protein